MSATMNLSMNMRMSSLNTFVLLLTTYLVVWLQSTFNELRAVLGVQLDLLPSLMVYAALGSNLAGLTSVAVFGGLLYDSLSANPLGVTMLPLLMVGLAIHLGREYILRQQTYAQIILGLVATAAVPLMSLILLFNVNARPLVGWFSVWQWAVVSLGGAVFTPAWFRIFSAIGLVLNYRPQDQASFRPDREIKRGRQ